MEGERSILDAVFEDDDFDNGDDVDMDDLEEGELVQFNSLSIAEQSSGSNVTVANQEHKGTNQKRKAKRKKNKKKNKSLGPNVTDIDRFVLEACRNLKERKSYLVYTAIGCLGIAALSDLIKEISVAEAILLLSILSSDDLMKPLHRMIFLWADVDAVQACGGQLTHDGRRFRTGGGVLWSIIKAREPNAYKEIMKKSREFEKQFKNARSIQATGQRKGGSFQGTANSCKDGAPAKVSDGFPVIAQKQTPGIHPNPEEKHICVHDRLRRPVSYDDDLLGEAPKENALTC